MKINIISAYLSADGSVVAIASQSYFILNAEVDKEKGLELVEKINSIRMIETNHWTEKQ